MLKLVALGVKGCTFDRCIFWLMSLDGKKIKLAVGAYVDDPIVSSTLFLHEGQ